MQVSKPVVTRMQTSLEMFEENKMMECRLCLRSVSRQSSIPIFGDLDSAQETIWSCCQLQVRKDIWLPNTMCSSCDSDLKSLMNFKKLCTQNDAKARLTLVECQNIKVEEVMLDDHVFESNDHAVGSDIGECNLKPIPKCHVSSREQTCPTTGEHSRDLKCNVRSKSFVKRKAVLQHLKCHAETKANKCNLCSKYYSTKGNLLRHLKRQTGEKLFECDTCSKCFARKSNLIEHIQYHIGKKPYKCEICSKSFVMKRSLKLHMKYHLKEDHKCELCSKSFLTNARLTLHMKYHIEEKQHKCEICSKKFLMRGKLTLHMRIHTGEKPHKCKICSKCFRRKCHVTVHMKVHNKTPKI